MSSAKWRVIPDGRPLMGSPFLGNNRAKWNGFYDYLWMKNKQLIRAIILYDVYCLNID